MTTTQERPRDGASAAILEADFGWATQIDGGVGVTVVFLSGRDEGRKSWSHVLPLLQQPVRAVTYDRSGIGDSDARPHHQRPVPYSAVAAELHDLLNALAAPDPYILVGHSFGGLIARVYLGRPPGIRCRSRDGRRGRTRGTSAPGLIALH
jgi:pimeloyl-ACP methyl ester carboxylesterase